MGSRVTKATVTELLALVAVAAPFIGYGLSEWVGNGLYFIIGAGVFCAWMMLVPVLFLGTYKRRAADRETPTDTADAPDTPSDA